MQISSPISYCSVPFVPHDRRGHVHVHFACITPLELLWNHKVLCRLSIWSLLAL